MRSLSSTDHSADQFKSAPRALRESLVFPYEQGSEWATRLYRQGGWDTVSQAFTKLPQSTEQILHPEKYFAYESPVKVVLPDLRSLLGPSWKRIDYDVNGEWSYYLILDQFLKSSAESKRASAGWGGDRYAVYEGPAGDIFIVQSTTWDTEEDAREFFEAYTYRTDLRYPDSTKTGPKAGQETPNVESELHMWTTKEHGVVLERRGKRVMIAEGIPEKTDAKLLLKTLWQ